MRRWGGGGGKVRENYWDEGQSEKQRRKRNKSGVNVVVNK
jgi:hypothetical protein